MRILAALALVACGTLPAFADSPKEIPVAGLVLDVSTGQPIAGATVTVKDGEPVTTDEHGEWKAVVSPTTRWRAHQAIVEAEGRAPSDIWVRAPGYLKSVRAPTAWLGPICGRISGRVVRADGTAVAGASVELDLPGSTGGILRRLLRIKADEEGRFGPVPATAGLVTISAHGSLAYQVWASRFVYPGRTVDEDFELVAPPIEEVEGRLVDADGAPIPGAAVRCRPEIDHETVTDAKGRFRWPVPVEGYCRVWFRKDGFVSGVRRPFLLSAADRGPFVLVRGPDRASVPEEEPPKDLLQFRLAVVDPQSRPVPGAEIRIRFQPIHAASYTDTAGRASFRIANGRASGLVIRHPHFAEHKRRFEVPESGEIDFGTIVMLPSEVKLDVVVVDGKGRGLPSACLMLRRRDDSEGRYARIIPADANGLIRSPSTSRASLMAPGRARWFPPSTPKAGEKLSLPEGRSIAGVVVNPEGVPLYGVRVDLDRWRPTFTDGLGRFRFDHLVTGEKVRLSVWSDLSIHRKWKETEVLATPGQEKLRIVMREE